MEKFSICIMLAIIIASCGKFNSNKKYLVKNYYLIKSEDVDVYYLERDGFKRNGGVFEGVIKSIGWNSKTIAAEVKPLVNTGNYIFMTLDINSNKYTIDQKSKSLADFEKKHGIVLKDVNIAAKQK